MAEAPRILHVIPRVVRRGAEVFAAQLAEVLNRHDDSRNILFPLFGPAEGEPSGDVRVVPGARPPGPIEVVARFDPGGLARMRAGLRKLKPDLMVAHGGDPLSYAVLADPRNRFPLAYRKISHAVGSRGERILGRFMSRPSVILAVTDELADELAEVFGVDRSRVRVVPTARRPPPKLTAPQRNAFRKELGASDPRAPMVAWVGRLSEEKQPGVALQVFALARSRMGGAPVTLAMAGDGPLRGQVERAAGDGVLVLGSRDDADRVIAASDALLSTSTIEGAPGVLVEAGLAGVPVVAFDVGEVSRIVRDGETGVLAPPGFVEALAVVLVDVLEDRERRTAMGKAAKKACAPFSVDAVAPEYANAFRDAIAAHRPR